MFEITISLYSSLVFISILSAINIGDDVGRSICYGLWSVLVPVGYNRDPGSPLHYSKIPLGFGSQNLIEQDEVRHVYEDREVHDFEKRAKYFLTCHVLCSALLLGPCILAAVILVQADSNFHDSITLAFHTDYLNVFFVPLLGLSLGFSLILARPYHRCHCSDRETPKGNIIV